MSYFPIRVKITEDRSGFKEGEERIFNKPEDLPQGVSFKVVETCVKPKEPTKREQFLSGYSGQKLLEKHNLSEYGNWKIHGEDPNCDFGGHHHQPYLGTVEGTLDKVIDYAVNLPSFWQWGAGGEITKVEIKKL
jgi:hypothetical protein